MENYKYKVMGCSFNELSKLEDKFDEIMDCGEEKMYASKETFHHTEDYDNLNFDYKYVIDCVMCEGKVYYELSLAVLPKSCCKEYLEGVMECCGLDNIEDIDLYDTNSYGGSGIQFGVEVEDFGEDENCEWNDEILNKIASIFESMDRLRGFYLDKAWNMIGTTGWNTLDHCINNEPLFKF